ncbi:unnamed protein product [Oppiella nova]|uniref:UMP-CMP kinase n=1 Tax=Oppiella nova TaxID=334625 RepID=A0A7R9LNR2_9ACAR|nr:unnamed protein product [Oppiella nova]CAG2165469.1 unnamed protein product [Oppiella nova]
MEVLHQNLFNQLGVTYVQNWCFTKVETKPWVVFVLGGPGAGKGTQCERIRKQFGFIHLSAGDLLRAEQNTEGSQYGALIEWHMRTSTIVPVEITYQLLDNAMKRSSGSGRKFVIDGFPLNRDNLDVWQREMTHKVDLKFVLFFDCPRDVCVQRCLKRGNSGRSDDNLESVNKRFNNYLMEIVPIIRYYEKSNLVHKVDANLPPDQVFQEVRQIFEKLN